MTVSPLQVGPPTRPILRSRARPRTHNRHLRSRSITHSRHLAVHLLSDGRASYANLVVVPVVYFLDIASVRRMATGK